jgi:hypothetical protein
MIGTPEGDAIKNTRTRAAISSRLVIYMVDKFPKKAPRHADSLKNTYSASFLMHLN